MQKITKNISTLFEKFGKKIKLDNPDDIYQIKYFREAFYHAKFEANETEIQVMSNMNDLNDFIGVTLESLRSPSGADAWHHKAGYQSSSNLAIESFIFHKQHGQVARLTHLF